MTTLLSKYTTLKLFALLAILLVPRVAQGQTYSCMSASSPVAVDWKNSIVRLVTATDSLVGVPPDTVRLTYALPMATASQVSIVTQTNTCKTAGQAYLAAEG